MSTLFPQWMNALPGAVAVGLGAAGVGVVAGVWYYFTPSYWEVGYMPEQPVAFSHQIHAGKLGMDCRYCHTDVEKSSHANVPDTATCLNCHAGDDTAGGYFNIDLWEAHKVNQNLVKVRTAYVEDRPIEWRRIHKVPDYAHFNHSVHLNAGVSCYSCHGRIDEMEVVYQKESLSMGWCLTCHRDPAPHLVDVDGILDPDNPVRITDLETVQNLLDGPEQRKNGELLMQAKQLQPPEHCAACHY
ncbi:MAG: cytochrome c3 family protein [Phycisphaerales bacterium JB065]